MERSFEVRRTVRSIFSRIYPNTEIRVLPQQQKSRPKAQYRSYARLRLYVDMAELDRPFGRRLIGNIEELC